MKKIKFLSIFLTVALCASFTSCSKKDEPAKDLNSVVGNWFVNITETEEGMIFSTDISVVYKADLSYTVTVVMFDQVIASEVGTYVYNSSSKILTTTGLRTIMGMQGDVETETFTIVEITATKMTVKDSDDETLVYTRK